MGSRSADEEQEAEEKDRAQGHSAHDANTREMSEHCPGAGAAVPSARFSMPPAVARQAQKGAADKTMAPRMSPARVKRAVCTRPWRSTAGHSRHMGLALPGRGNEGGHDTGRRSREGGVEADLGGATGELDLLDGDLLAWAGAFERSLRRQLGLGGRAVGGGCAGGLCGREDVRLKDGAVVAVAQRLEGAQQEPRVALRQRVDGVRRRRGHGGRAGVA